MSYTLHPYLIDIAKLQALCGSGDRTLAKQIVRENADEIRRMDRYASEQIEKGAPTFTQAIQEIVDGHIGTPWFAYQYGYALELICRHLGDDLPNDLFENMHLIYEEEVGILDRFYKSGPPVAIPKPADFPVIGHLPSAEARNLFEELKDRDLTADEEIITAGREQVRDWLEEAVREDKGIVVFTW